MPSTLTVLISGEYDFGFNFKQIKLLCYLCNVLQGPSERDKHQKHWWGIKECCHMISVTVHDINHQYYHLRVGLNVIATKGAI